MSTAIEILRAEGWRPSRLARELKGITPQAISQWRQVPAERVVDVARITGIPVHVLRPDLAAIFGEPADSNNEAA